MINHTVGASVLIAFLLIKGIYCCKTHVCLTWNLSENQLNLKCKVDKLHFKVKIINPVGTTVGYCSAGYKRTCDSPYSNVKVSQNIETNETFCHVQGYKTDHVNGNWKCIHGSGTGEANVEVTILGIGEKHCIAKTFVHALIGFSVTIITWVILMCCFKLQIRREEGTQKRRIIIWITNSNVCASDKCKTFRSNLVYKAVTVAGLTSIILIVTVLVGWRDTEPCTATYIFSAVAIIYGNILFLFCYYNQSETSQIEENEQME